MANIGDITLSTNAQLWEDTGMSAKYPQFQSWSSKQLFSENGYEAMKQVDGLLDDFYNLTVKFYLLYIDRLDVKDPFEQYDFGETFSMPFGEYAQIIRGQNYKPIDAQWLNTENIKDGADVNPYIHRQPKLRQRFFKTNFNYQNTISIPDNFRYKKIIAEPYGMATEAVNVTIKGLENGYKIMQFEKEKEAINAYLNSKTYPLKSTQVITWTTAGATPTNDEYRSLLESIMTAKDYMVFGPTTTAFNSDDAETLQEEDRLRLMMKPWLKNGIRTQLMSQTYNSEDLNVNIKTLPFIDFGGLEAYKDSAYTTKLYPVYSDDVFHIQIGYSETEGQLGESNVQYADKDVFYKDPNADVVAVLADKGLVKRFKQNDYTVRTAPNPRTLETHYWASSPNNTIAVDPDCNCIVIVHKNGAQV